MIPNKNLEPRYLFKISGTNEYGIEMFSTLYENGSSKRIPMTHAGYSTEVIKFTLTIKFIDTEKMPSENLNYVNNKEALDNVSRMFGDEKYSDFTCIVGNRPFKVHKALLAAASPVFDRMFTTAMAESRTNEAKIESIEPEIFEYLLRFIYGGKSPENLANVAVELYKAAHYYELERLKNICETELKATLSNKNAPEVYGLASVYELEELKKNSWLIIKR
jgi:hypothetical protein